MTHLPLECGRHIWMVPKESGGGFFGSFFDKRQVLPQTTAHSAQLSMKHRDGRPV